MFWIIAILACTASLALIITVLLQPSKSGAVGGALGSLNSSLGARFGSRRTLDFLAKATAYAAGTLAVLCLVGNLFLTSGTGQTKKANVTEGAAAAPTTAPKATAPAGAAPAQSAPPAGTAPAQSAPPAGTAPNPTPQPGK